MSDPALTLAVLWAIAATALALTFALTDSRRAGCRVAETSDTDPRNGERGKVPPTERDGNA